MIKAFFFDLDGTLVNTYQADFEAYRDAIAEVMDIVIDQSAFEETHGKEMHDKFAMLGLEPNETQIEQIAATKKQHYKKYLHLTEANTSLVDFLKSFADNHKIVLVTTAKRANAKLVIQEHGLADLFDDMVCGDDVKQAKPNPESYLVALERNNLKPNEVVAFEDSPTGLEAAEAAGLAVVHVKEFAV